MIEFLLLKENKDKQTIKNNCSDHFLFKSAKTFFFLDPHYADMYIYLSRDKLKISNKVSLTGFKFPKILFSNINTFEN